MRHGDRNLVSAQVMNAKLKGHLPHTIRIRGVSGPSRPTGCAILRDSQTPEGSFCARRLNHADSAQMGRPNDEAVRLPLR